MKRIPTTLTLIILLFGASLAPAQTVKNGPGLEQFTSEASAKEHCPSDQVVWLNTASDVYHFKGQRWYGHTKHGAYVCQKDAEKVGDRATKNGQ